jgi:hypothetical protein
MLHLPMLHWMKLAYVANLPMLQTCLCCKLVACLRYKLVTCLCCKLVYVANLSLVYVANLSMLQTCHLSLSLCYKLVTCLCYKLVYVICLYDPLHNSCMIHHFCMVHNLCTTQSSFMLQTCLCYKSSNPVWYKTCLDITEYTKHSILSQNMIQNRFADYTLDFWPLSVQAECCFSCYPGLLLSTGCCYIPWPWPWPCCPALLLSTGCRCPGLLLSTGCCCPGLLLLSTKEGHISHQCSACSRAAIAGHLALMHISIIRSFASRSPCSFLGGQALCSTHSVRRAVVRGRRPALRRLLLPVYLSSTLVVSVTQVF